MSAVKVWLALVALTLVEVALAWVHTAPALMLGLLPRMPGLRLLPARSVVIEASEAPVQTDGDAGGAAPLEVTDVDRPIPVLVP